MRISLELEVREDCGVRLCGAVWSRVKSQAVSRRFRNMKDAFSVWMGHACIYLLTSSLGLQIGREDGLELNKN